MHRIIMLIAVALVAASCGGDGETASTLESLDGRSSVTLPRPVTDTSPPSPTPASTDTTVPPAPTPIGPVVLPDSDYPDVVVADLAGGGSLLEITQTR